MTTALKYLIKRRGLLFVLSSPSGAGKTTITRALLDRDEELTISISVTTRQPRPGEVDGQDYHFITKEEFDRMVEKKELLEHAKVFGNYYGTPLAPVEDALEKSQDIIFDIDWQGTQQLYQRMETDVVRVFLLPPSLDELRRRLTARATDSAEVIAARMERAQAEISHWDGYDYVVVNDHIDECFARVVQILAAERLRRARQTGLVGFVRELMRVGE